MGVVLAQREHSRSERTSAISKEGEGEDISDARMSSSDMARRLNISQRVCPIQILDAYDDQDSSTLLQTEGFRRSAVIEDGTFDTWIWWCDGQPPFRTEQWPSCFLGQHERREDDGSGDSRVLHATPLHSRCMHLRFTYLHPLNHACDQEAVDTKY